MISEIDRYASLSSPIHRWDPRFRLVSIFTLIFSVVLLYNLQLVIIGMIFAVILTCTSKIPFSFVLARMKLVFIFVIPFFIIIPFTIIGTGVEIASFSGITLSYRGIEYVLFAAMIVLKALTAVMLIFPMIGTSRMDITIKALEGLHLPNKLVQMFAFTYRYIFVLDDEFMRTDRALAARGFKKRGNMYTLTTVSKAIAMLFVKSYERADRVFYAMRSKGYTGTIATLHEFHARKQDWVNTAVVIGFALLLQVAATSDTFIATRGFI
ncbi:MAG: cobalt ECF transporter T component CbiQ [Methanosarcinales archaeon]|nr:MAG: cobalt ECF transporter T component CbiQ [Methanosarcinales archaeon]